MKLSEQMSHVGQEAYEYAPDVAQLEAKLESITCGECEKNMLECECEVNDEL